MQNRSFCDHSHKMNSNQLNFLLCYFTSTVFLMTMTGSAKKSKLGPSLISYMEMKNIFQELGAEEAVLAMGDDSDDMANYKTKANQNLLYHLPLPPESKNNYGRPIQYWPYYQQQRPLQLQQEQYQHRPQYLPLPLSQQPQQNAEEGQGDVNNVDDAEPVEEPSKPDEIEISQNQKEEEKVELLDLIDVHFDYSDMDTIEGGMNDGEDFQEFMEMVE